MRRLRLQVFSLFFLPILSFADYPEDGTISFWEDCSSLGDWVWFTVANNGDAVIGFPGTPPYEVRDLDTGSLVTPPAGTLPMPWTMPPHTEYADAWFAHESFGEGFFMIVMYYQAWGTYYTVRDTVEISSHCPPTAVERHSWGSLKNLFR